MAYCVVSDVRSIVDTDLTDAEITNLITWADDWTDKKIGVVGVTAVFQENVSATYTAYRCMLKDPSAMKLGELSVNREMQIKLLKQELDELIASGGTGISVVVSYEALG